MQTVYLISGLVLVGTGLVAFVSPSIAWAVLRSPWVEATYEPDLPLRNVLVVRTAGLIAMVVGAGVAVFGAVAFALG